ncbi:hypothetical protein Rhe02_08990 [Rhizocola hellebori]|uniref:Uncharacterized protein n=1 Tax=Rhizocola hellebori TaxID=1392758 RepID=A0A8J3VDY5_9ACTN|nr:hypothetical protein Rhe02_08990 [Rhizocola hellebori]
MRQFSCRTKSSFATTKTIHTPHADVYYRADRFSAGAAQAVEQEQRLTGTRNGDRHPTPAHGNRLAIGPNAACGTQCHACLATYFMAQLYPKMPQFKCINVNTWRLSQLRDGLPGCKSAAATWLALNDLDLVVVDAVASTKSARMVSRRVITHVRWAGQL